MAIRRLDVGVEQLWIVLGALPGNCRLVGSLSSPKPGIVSLVFDMLGIDEPAPAPGAKIKELKMKIDDQSPGRRVVTLEDLSPIVPVRQNIIIK